MRGCETKMAKIFLSYARADASEIAEELADQLRIDHEVFLDKHSIRAGAQWKKELSRRVKWADLMVVLVTPKSNDSDYVYEETLQAATLEKPIIPVQVEGTPLPVHLRGTWQAVTFENGNYEAVHLEIERSLKEIGTRKRLPLYGLAGLLALSLIIALLWFIIMNDSDPDSGSSENNTSVTDEPTATLTATLTFTPSYTPTATPTRTPRPPTETPTPSPTSTEIPEELILYEEDFEDGVTTGWDVKKGVWQVVEMDDGNHVYQATGSWAEAYIGTPNWSDYAFSLKMRVPNNIEILIHVRSSDFFYGYVVGVTRTDNWLGVAKKIDNRWIGLAGDDVPLRREEWNSVYVEIKGQTLQVSVDGYKLPPVTDETFEDGGIGLIIGGSPGSEGVQFDDIRVWSLSK